MKSIETHPTKESDSPANFLQVCPYAYHRICLHATMKNVQGSIGTGASLALRMGQVICSSPPLIFASLGSGFYSYTAFCFLGAVMGLAIPWSFTLALLDVYSLLAKCRVRQPGVLLVVILGDSVLSVLMLAAGSSSAGVVHVSMKADVIFFCPSRLITRYQIISSGLAFLSWFLSSISFLSNLWLLPTAS